MLTPLEVYFKIAFKNPKFIDNKRPLDKTTIDTILNNEAKNPSATHKPHELAQVNKEVMDLKKNAAKQLEDFKNNINIKFPLESPQLEEKIREISAFFSKMTAEVRATLEQNLAPLDQQKREKIDTFASSYVFNLFVDAKLMPQDVGKPLSQLFTDVQLVFNKQDPVAAYDDLLFNGVKRIRGGFSTDIINGKEKATPIAYDRFAVYLDTLGETKFRDYLTKILPTYDNFQGLSPAALKKEVDSIVVKSAALGVNANKTATTHIAPNAQQSSNAKRESSFGKLLGKFGLNKKETPVDLPELSTKEKLKIEEGKKFKTSSPPAFNNQVKPDNEPAEKSRTRPRR